MRIIRKLVASLAFLAITAVVVMFALSNREVVPVSLWPVAETTSYRLSVMLLGALAIGIVLGGAISWASGAGRRRRRRERQARAPTPDVAEPAFGGDRPQAAEPKRLPAVPNRG